MAFPNVATTNVLTAAGSATTHAMPLPASLASGDLLVIFFSIDAAGGTITTPAGWTQLFTASNSPVVASCFYKISNGAEGASVTITHTSGKAGGTSYRISTGTWSGTPEAAATAATGSSATPDPPSVTPSWGSADNLFLAASFIQEVGVISSAPTNYSNALTGASGSTSAVTTGSAQRQLTSATDDPGTFTWGSSSTWLAQTVVIKPAQSGGRFFAMF